MLSLIGQWQESGMETKQAFCREHDFKGYNLHSRVMKQVKEVYRKRAGRVVTSQTKAKPGL